MYCFITFSNIYNPNFSRLESIEAFQAEEETEVGTIIDDEWLLETPSSFDGKVETVLPKGFYSRKIKLDEIAVFESDILYDKPYLRLINKTTKWINGKDVSLNVYENINAKM